jgi:hypothetical protein
MQPFVEVPHLLAEIELLLPATVPRNGSSTLAICARSSGSSLPCRASHHLFRVWLEAFPSSHPPGPMAINEVLGSSARHGRSCRLSVAHLPSHMWSVCGGRGSRRQDLHEILRQLFPARSDVDRSTDGRLAAFFPQAWSGERAGHCARFRLRDPCTLVGLAASNNSCLSKTEKSSSHGGLPARAFRHCIRLHCYCAAAAAHHSLHEVLQFPLHVAPARQTYSDRQSCILSRQYSNDGREAQTASIDYILRSAVLSLPPAIEGKRPNRKVIPRQNHVQHIHPPSFVANPLRAIVRHQSSSATQPLQLGYLPHPPLHLPFSCSCIAYC